MADTAIAITAGTGTNVDTRTEATNGNHRQVVVLGDPATNAGVAPVDATNGLSVNVTNASLTVASHAVTNAGTFAVQVTSAPSTAVTNAGTFAVQAAATLAAETTKNIGTVRMGDGTNTAAVKAASTAPVATDPAVVVALSPNSVNANGQATMANSAPVVLASNQSAIATNATTVDPYSQYETVAASASAQVMGATGATGDYLAGVLVFPGTAGCGVVTVLDNATTIGTFAGGGTTALPSLVPFMIPIGLFSVSGAWKITTGANVTAVGIGKFT